MGGSPSALREAPPAAPRHWCRFHTANFTYIVLSSSSFVDQLSSANAIDASVRRGDGEGDVRSENWSGVVVGKKLGPFILFTATARPVVADNALETRVRWVDGSIGRLYASRIAPIGVDLGENEDFP